MPAIDRDAQQELHQRSLRNVRVYLDREEAETAKGRRTGRVLFLALLPFAAFIAWVVAWHTGYARKGVEVDPKVQACTAQVWAEMSGEHEREIRARNPGIEPKEVAKRVRANRHAVEAAAARKCGKTPS